MTSYQLKQKLDLRSGPKRSAGVHLSSVLREVGVRSGELGKQYADQNLEELIGKTGDVGSNGSLMRLVIGFAWEDWIAKQIPEMVHQPGELELDGVFGSRDGEAFDEEGNRVLHEIKSTHKSSKNSITSFTMWMWQAMGYLKMMTEYYDELCNRAIFHVLFLRGDYSGIDPQYRSELVIFEREEIESLWNMVLVNKHLAKAEGGNG